MSNDTIGREPIRILEIVQPKCALSFGEGLCTATGEPCFNTRKTCRLPSAYDESASVTWRFCDADANRPPDLFEIDGDDIKTNPIPALVSAETSPTVINIGGVADGSSALGIRSSLSVTLRDFQYDDKYADPYVDQRDYDAFERSTFIAKYLARNPYYINDVVRLYEGYHGDSLDDMISTEFLINTISNPSSSGQVMIKAADPLRLTDAKRSAFPFTSYSYLAFDISDTQTSNIRISATEEDLTAQIKSSVLYLAIGSEIVSYTGVSFESEGVYELTGVTRAALGTTADSAESGDAVQRVGSFENEALPDILKFLLSSEYGSSINESYLDYDGWVSEITTYGSQFLDMSCYFAEPDSIQSLVASLCNECGLSVWWDERSRLIKIRLTRPPAERPEVLTEESNIIAGSFVAVDDQSQRISRVLLAYSPHDWTEMGSLSDFKQNYWSVDLESEELYEEERNKIFKCRFATTSGQTARTASSLNVLFSDTPKISSFTLDAKDCRFWTGDIIDIRHSSLVNEFGGNTDMRFFITSAKTNHSAGTISYKALSFSFIGNYGTLMASDAPTYTERTENYGMWLCDADGYYSNGDEGYKLQ